MWSLPKPRCDLETIRAVAAAYRQVRQTGHLDELAREAAIAAFRMSHPVLARQLAPRLHSLR